MLLGSYTQRRALSHVTYQYATGRVRSVRAHQTYNVQYPGGYVIVDLETGSQEIEQR